MKKTALIMAGGRGERFWPRSRRHLPKQFLSLTNDGKTMLQLTTERILPLVDMDGVYVSTNWRYKALVQEQLPQLPEENILCEPTGRNTAPCIGLGAVHIKKKYGDAVMFVLPADHLITYPQIFRRTLMDAMKTTEMDRALVTIGIVPNYPEVGYGYIRFRSDDTLGSAYAVENFVEKPDLETAKSYVQSQEYLWNSGMFIWKTSVILENIRMYLPDMWEGLNRIENSIGTAEQDEVLEREFRLFRAVSIDYGVMEKAKDVYVLTGSFGWDDVGSWLALERLQEKNDFGNIITGNVVTVETSNTIIQGDKKLIAAVGLQDSIIIDTQDAVLVCSKNRVGDIRKVVENLKICNRTEYL